MRRFAIGLRNLCVMVALLSATVLRATAQEPPTPIEEKYSAEELRKLLPASGEPTRLFRDPYEVFPALGTAVQETQGKATPAEKLSRDGVHFQSGHLDLNFGLLFRCAREKSGPVTTATGSATVRLSFRDAVPLVAVLDVSISGGNASPGVALAAPEIKQHREELQSFLEEQFNPVSSTYLEALLSKVKGKAADLAVSAVVSPDGIEVVRIPGLPDGTIVIGQGANVPVGVIVERKLVLAPRLARYLGKGEPVLLSKETYRLIPYFATIVPGWGALRAADNPDKTAFLIGKGKPSGAAGHEDAIKFPLKDESLIELNKSAVVPVPWRVLQRISLGPALDRSR